MPWGAIRPPTWSSAAPTSRRQRFPQVRFLFFGDKTRIVPVLGKLPLLDKVSTVHHAEQEVRADDKPSRRCAAGRDSSMWLAIEAVREGHADVVVSAGNTGALMAMAKFVLKTMPGIDRPAIAVVLARRCAARA